MQIVIDIPDVMFKQLKWQEKDIREQEYVYLEAILDGTPLPKGHGRLIDADDVVQEYRKQVMVSMSEGEMLDLLIDLFEDSATVIEPYKETDNE